ncbi:MAG: glycosyltransferase family 2 protein [Gemmobacter sp.]
MTMTWSLVSTMLGVPETVLPCIAHHLNSDAERLHIYLDAPLPQIEAALAAHPRCVVTVCDKAYWARIPGGRPDGIVRRQMANVEHARRHSSSDWLVHVDSDEFLVSADPSKPLRLGEELEKVPAHHEWVRIAPMERVLPPAPEPQSIFDGMFRDLSDDAELIAAAYGEGATYLKRGLSGHVRGKVGFRRQTGLKVRLHDVIKPPRDGVDAPVVVSAKNLPPFTSLDSIRLLHFEGWSPLHWASKLVRFAEEGRFGHHSGRRASVRFMADHPVAEDRLGLFNRVQRLTPRGVALLAEANLLRQEPFDPATLTRNTFPGVDMDFGVDACDARLRASSPDFYYRNDL